jgi:hypothetical protein
VPPQAQPPAVGQIDALAAAGITNQPISQQRAIRLGSLI